MVHPKNVSHDSFGCTRYKCKNTFIAFHYLQLFHTKLLDMSDTTDNMAVQPKLANMDMEKPVLVHNTNPAYNSGNNSRLSFLLAFFLHTFYLSANLFNNSAFSSMPSSNNFINLIDSSGVCVSSVRPFAFNHARYPTIVNRLLVIYSTPRL